ncbi:helix-turn-helix transcriptional regulator [Phyllobacterium sp. NPDC097923]|uniref:helix-turn-helix transcriptional regulator n=1 Tax=Phyllobacterium sp. NPDC097923 TaxID=3364404 RepID=UPI00383BE86A
MVEITMNDFNNLVQTIYNAAVDQSKWSKFLEDTSNLLDGTNICIQAHDVVERASLGLITSEIDENFKSAYNEYYAAKNVWVPHLTCKPVGQTFHSEEFCDRNALIKTEFYNDFLRTQDIVAASGVILKRNAGRLLILSGNMRGKQAEYLQASVSNIFNLLGSHIARSFEIMRSVPSLVQNEDYRSALEGTTGAIFFIDRLGGVIHSNQAIAAVPQATTVFRIERSGRLKLLDEQADIMLQSALGAIVRTDYRRLKGTFAVKSRNGSALRATVAPLSRNTIETVFDRVFEDIPVALLILHPVSSEPDASALQGYGLTPAETALAHAIARGISPLEYADTKKISVQTVRTQLKAIFLKTETRRQSQIAALFLSRR